MKLNGPKFLVRDDAGLQLSPINSTSQEAGQ